MSAWIDFVKRVQKRDSISYTEALRKASGEWKKTKGNATKGASLGPENWIIQLRKVISRLKRGTVYGESMHTSAFYFFCVYCKWPRKQWLI